jgi:hypothetical protein
LGQYAFRATYQNSDGMTFADINKDGTGMGEVWIIFIVEWVVFLVLAWYLEQVISSATGIRKHWLFPFQCAPSPLISPAIDKMQFCSYYRPQPAVKKTV